MVSKTCVGEVKKHRFGHEVDLYLDAPRKPEEAKLALRITQLLDEFLDKMIRVTIQEIEG